MARYWVVASVNGDCCNESHVMDAFVAAPNAGDAIGKFERRLERKGYLVGDCSVVRRTKAVLGWAKAGKRGAA